ncbi:MAG: hypothetical protein ACWA5T_02495 [Parvularcula sp.]
MPRTRAVNPISRADRLAAQARYKAEIDQLRKDFLEKILHYAKALGPEEIERRVAERARLDPEMADEQRRFLESFRTSGPVG